MRNKLHTQTKYFQKLSSTFSHTPVQGMFESRSSVVQHKQQDNSQQPDLKTSLKQAEKYGHHPNQIQSANIASNVTPLQPKTGIEQSQIIQPKFKWPFSKKKTTTSAAPAPMAQTPMNPNPTAAHWNNLGQNEFKPGDMLYGLRDARPQGAVTEAAAGQPNVIDQLNNQFLGTNFLGGAYKNAGAEAKNNPTSPASQQWRTAASYGVPKSGGRPTTAQQDLEALSYRRWLERHPKYSPTTTDVRGEPLSSPFRQWDRVKKSTKAGLEYTTKAKQNNVHFVLDGLNQNAVVNKLDHQTMTPEKKINPDTQDSQQSITASELRFLYRKQNDSTLINNVQFWEGGQRVDAPWMTNPALWSQYKPKSWGRLGVAPSVTPDMGKELNTAFKTQGII